MSAALIPKWFWRRGNNFHSARREKRLKLMSRTPKGDHRIRYDYSNPTHLFIILRSASVSPSPVLLCLVISGLCAGVAGLKTAWFPPLRCGSHHTNAKWNIPNASALSMTKCGERMSLTWPCWVSSRWSLSCSWKWIEFVSRRDTASGQRSARKLHW